MGHRKTGPHEELEDKVTITDSPHAVLSQRLKSKLLCKELAIDGKGVSRKGSAAKRQNGNARDELLQSLKIIAEREGVREQEMRPPDWLSALGGIEISYRIQLGGISYLQMGVAGQKIFSFPIRTLDDHSKKGPETCLYICYLIKQPETHVGGNLVISRTASMEFSASGRADQLAEPPFVGCVDVLVIGLNGELHDTRSNRRGKMESFVSLTCPVCHSWPTASSPWIILLSSSLVRMPTSVRAFAYAMEPWMSAAYIRLS